MTVALSFLSPSGLALVSLAAVPLIIHFLSRRRWRVVRWAAMEFLMRAMRKHRRRLRFENLFLLLLRMAAVACLALAGARPVSEERALPLARSESLNLILAVDASYSMGFQEAGETVLSRACGLARSRIAALTQADRLVIVRAAATSDVLFDDQMTEDARLRAREFLESMGPAATPLDVGALLSRLLRCREEIAAEKGGSVAIEVLTDLQARDWLGPGRKPDTQVAEALAALAGGGARLVVTDLGSAGRVNVGVVDVRLDRTLVAADVPVDVQGFLRNWSSEDVPGLAVDLLVDGNQVQGRRVDMPAAKGRMVAFRHTFRDAGVHALSLELRTDGLRLDNRRFVALNVRKAVNVLLVDGNEDAEERERATFYLDAALRPQGDELLEALSPFRVVTVPANRLSSKALAGCDAAVLADVARPGGIAGFREFLGRGGALLIFLGGNVAAESYNQEIFSSDAGICPLRLKTIAGDPTLRFGVLMEPAALEHPVMRFFVDREDVRLDSAPVWRFYRAEPGEGVRVLASFKDPEGSPAMVECSSGQGKVVVVMTTADAQWTNLPKWPDFVPLVHELLSYMVTPPGGQMNLLVGWPYRRVYPAVAYAEEVRVRAPGGGVTSTSLRNLGEAGEGDFQLVFDGTEETGVYEVSLSRGGAVDSLLEERYPAEDRFAVNAVAEEGDLTPAGGEELARAYGAAAPNVVVPGEVAGEAAGGAGPVRQDLWRPLLWLVLALFLAESVVAAAFGRRQR